jgi:di-trans,poly-cis-decaprenylcistransferase
LENLVIPKSIAIILDGNGRWAERRNLPRAMGHKAGCEALEKTVEDCVRLGVECLTVYAFSTENWKRSAVEVSALMKLLRFYMVKLIDVANKNNVKAVMIGDESRFDPDIRKGIQKLVDATSSNTGMTFAFAINYGGRDEIKRAIEHIVDDAAAGVISKENINEELISSYLDTKNLPDPDLLIRTSGELRVSNFLLWQIAYSEFYITDTLWPDFDKEELLKAVESYSKRQRRFGGR